MKHMDNTATERLLLALDEEINIKCEELKEKNTEIRLQKLFFSSCIFILAVFFLQLFFKIFNFNFIFIMVIYEITALVIFVPAIPNLTKGGIIK